MSSLASHGAEHLSATFLAGRLATPGETLPAMETHRPWRQSIPLLANMDFKGSPPQTELMPFTPLRRGHVTP